VDFKQEDYVKVIGVNGDYRYAFVVGSAERGQHITLCMHEEGDSRLGYEEAAMRWIGLAPTDWVKGLSATEKKILVWLAQEIPTKQMAENLRLSPNTIRVHLRTLRLKLRLENRGQLQVYAKALAKRLEGQPPRRPG